VAERKDGGGADISDLATNPAIARGPITAGLMLAILMISTDASIVNVALPNMQGSLSASSEQITWVLTSFIVSQVVMIPISGWIGDRFGVKTMLLASVALFTLVSVFCGMATTLPEMVALRVLQGMTGAPAAPLAQTVMLTIYPPARFGRSMALFTMAAVTGPIIGPVLGGYVTEEFTWRWCFYINLVAGPLSLFLVWTFLPKFPKRTPRRFDCLGFSSLAISIASLQLMLDRGPTQDWFNSPEVCAEALVMASAIWIYVTHTATAKHPLFNPGLARNRNFVAATIITMFFSVLLFSSVALLPLMTQGLMGYTVMLSALVSVPRCIVVVAILQVMGRLDTWIDRRALIAFGLAALTLSFVQMGQFNLDMGAEALILVSISQGFGHGLISAPLTVTAVGGLSPELRTDGAAINNLIRTLGGSIGIAAMEAMAVFNGQRMHAAMAAHVQLADPVVRAGLSAPFSPETVQGALRLNEEISRQSMMVAYVDDFRLMVFLTLCAAPMLLLIRKPRAVNIPLPSAEGH
jgi:DHA2 family multidrug resistance protein